MTTALQIIEDAYERCNRLSPGEPLGADDAAFGFRRLNALVDELSAKPAFLFRDTITAAAQSGNITLGAGAWVSIPPGSRIVTMSADGWLMGQISVAQYQAIPVPNSTGTPDRYASDGFATVYLYPLASGQQISIQTRVTVSAFADQETDYTLAPGWFSALAAALAVRIAPNIIGQIPASLVSAARMCMAAVDNYKPEVVDVYTYTKPESRSCILDGP